MNEHRRPADRPDRSATGLRRELLVLGLGLAVYFGGRKVVEGSRPDAVRDAELIIELEQRLGIDIERSVQDLVVDSDVLRTVGNLSYVWLHWPLLIAVLAVLFLRDRTIYRRLRNALFASGAVALGIFAVFPVAPPRFMPGFVGTVSDEARVHYLAIPLGWTNPYAAFPSFHVGWTLIACLALAALAGRRRLAVLSMLPALLVGMSVISTGNHYVVDAVGGAVIALTAYWWFGRARDPDRLHVDHPVVDGGRQHDVELDPGDVAHRRPDRSTLAQWAGRCRRPDWANVERLG